MEICQKDGPTNRYQDLSLVLLVAVAPADTVPLTVGKVTGNTSPVIAKHNCLNDLPWYGAGTGGGHGGECNTVGRLYVHSKPWRGPCGPTEWT